MFDWNNFLSFAKIAKPDHPECFHRTAISRAYYAAFHNALDFLISRGQSLPTDATCHKVVPDSLKALATTDRNSNYFSAGDNLKRLRVKRRIADYESAPNVKFNDVQLAIRLAEQISIDCR